MYSCIGKIGVLGRWWSSGCDGHAGKDQHGVEPKRKYLEKILVLLRNQQLYFRPLILLVLREIKLKGGFINIIVIITILNAMLSSCINITNVSLSPPQRSVVVIGHKQGTQVEQHVSGTSKSDLQRLHIHTRVITSVFSVVRWKTLSLKVLSQEKHQLVKVSVI
ncbi:hypothetical protein FKM82_001188 [Ascaphus truei]